MDMKVTNINENLGQQAYKRFKELLFKRVWKPGDFVSQSELVEKTGVQISPMRDALHRLSAEGFVIITPRKGVQVIPASIKTIREAFHLRIILEKGALIFFIEHAHDGFIIPMKKEHIRLFQKTNKVDSNSELRTILQNEGIKLHERLIDFMGNELVS